MIPAEELYHILHRKPFQPFRVHVKNGQFYDIRYEHLAVVGRTYFQIGIPAAHPADELLDLDPVEPPHDPSTAEPEHRETLAVEVLPLLPGGRVAVETTAQVIGGPVNPPVP